jgi:NADH-quinone oxidoreductase subunit F
VAIRGVKRFLVDQEKEIQLPEVRPNQENEDRKVAIIGAGPAGLSCGYFLARLGYRPTVLEALDRPGGMLVQTIPAYRLPREHLEREIRMIEQLGVTIETGKRLGRDFTLDSLRDSGYEAVFVGIGAPADTALKVPGAELEGVISAGDFLRAYNVSGNVPAGNNVVVIGGGNAAIDAARTALRLGAKKVTIVYRRTQEQMPAYAEEIDEAIAEGVEIRALTQPVAVEDDGSGKVAGLRCVKTKVGEFDRSGRRRPVETGGEPFVIDADRIIVAVGQKLGSTDGFGDDGPALGSDGFITVDPRTGQSSVPWVFAGGDCESGPYSVVAAIAGGERAAVGIDLLLTGETHAFWREDVAPDTAFDPDAEPVSTARLAMDTTPVARRSSFDEVERSWSKEAALQQARRCLRCDYGKCIHEPVELTKEALHA